jgi:hypothetical protein
LCPNRGGAEDRAGRHESGEKTFEFHVQHSLLHVWVEATTGIAASVAKPTTMIRALALRYKQGRIVPRTLRGVKVNICSFN